MRSLLIMSACAILFLGGCSSAHPEGQESSDGSGASGGFQSSHQPQTLVVQLCPGVHAQDAGKVAARHGVAVLKKSSPSILELGWNDERNIDAVMEELSEEKSVFCHVQPNYRYKAF